MFSIGRFQVDLQSNQTSAQPRSSIRRVRWATIHNRLEFGLQATARNFRHSPRGRTLAFWNPCPQPLGKPRYL